MGEITVEGSVGGKRATLDPIDGTKQEVTIPAWEVEHTLVAGLRQMWVEGQNDESEVELLVGAGVGSRWGTFEYTRKSDGAEVKLVFDAFDLVYALSALAEERLKERDHVPGTA